MPSVCYFQRCMENFTQSKLTITRKICLLRRVFEFNVGTYVPVYIFSSNLRGKTNLCRATIDFKRLNVQGQYLTMLLQINNNATHFPKSKQHCILAPLPCSEIKHFLEIGSHTRTVGKVCCLKMDQVEQVSITLLQN